MFKIADGREHFWQWDLDRQIIVDDPDITEVHFCNRTDDCSLVVEVLEEEVFADGKLFTTIRYANVPNILLQDNWDIRVYAYCGSCYTKVEQKFKVTARTKPSDYAYTETEIKSYEYLENKINEIEAKGFSDEAVSKGVHSYFDANPMGLVITDDSNGNITFDVESIPNVEEVQY